MALLAWCRLLILEQKLQFEFGKYNKYRRLCFDKRAKTVQEKLRIAREVWDGPGVNSLEAQAHELYLRDVQAHGRQRAMLTAKNLPPPDGHAPASVRQEPSKP